MAKSSIFIIPEASARDDGTSPSISFDAVTSFTPSKGRTLTKSPISTGSFVSEILSEKGGRVSLEAYVANNPVIIDQNNLIDTEDADTRSQAAYLALDNLYNAKDTVTIQYKFDKNLNSYILTKFEPMLMPSDIIGFRLEFQEVRFADEKRVQLVQNMSPTLTQAAAKNVVSGLAGKIIAGAKELGIAEKSAALAGELISTLTPSTGDN